MRQRSEAHAAGLAADEDKVHGNCGFSDGRGHAVRHLRLVLLPRLRRVPLEPRLAVEVEVARGGDVDDAYAPRLGAERRDQQAGQKQDLRLRRVEGLVVECPRGRVDGAPRAQIQRDGGAAVKAGRGASATAVVRITCQTLPYGPDVLVIVWRVAVHRGEHRPGSADASDHPIIQTAPVGQGGGRSIVSSA
jgi:hypothetical protein